MNQNNSDTKQILDAIKNMMSDSTHEDQQELPKNIMELTNPVHENITLENEKIDILELSNPITDGPAEVVKEDFSNKEKSNEEIIKDKQIRNAVKNAIKSLPPSKLDKIINEELTKVIQEKLISSKIIISTENKKN